MPKMRTLMPDEEAPDPAPVGTEGGEAAEARPIVPVPAQDWHDWLQELARPCEEPVVRTDTTAPYIGFASSRSPTWDFAPAAPPQGPGGRPLRRRCPTASSSWPTRSSSTWSASSSSGRRATISTTSSAWSSRDPGRHSGLKEEFLAVTVVHLGRRLVPTVSYFGGTKAGAIRPAADTLRKAGSPDWPTLGPAHAASANFPLPFGRFVTTVTVEPRTSRETGRQYQLAVGHVRPSNLEELDVLTQAVQDKEFLDQLQDGHGSLRVPAAEPGGDRPGRHAA